MNVLSAVVYKQPWAGAKIKVQGKTPEEARNNARYFCQALGVKLPEDTVIWHPEEKGFDPKAQGHVCKISIVFGEDEDLTEEIIQSFCA
jgi:hypothetical protein